MLENLVIAVESESQIVDLGRVSGFMQKVGFTYCSLDSRISNISCRFETALFSIFGQILFNCNSVYHRHAMDIIISPRYTCMRST